MVPMPSLTPLVRASAFFSRQVVYFWILFFSIVVVLLPVSIITYLSFYKMLVPIERIQVPAKFSSGELKNTMAFQLNPGEAVDFLSTNKDVVFSMRLNLNAICKTEIAFQPLEYSVDLFSTGTISDNVIVNCDSRYIYVEKNRLVPYNLRYWVPPILVDVFKFVHMDHPMLSMTGREWSRVLSAKAASIVLKNTNFLLIDSHNTFIDFVIEWDGLRYYLVKFYLTSFFIGAGTFWFLSSFFCILSALTFSQYLSRDPKTKEEQKQVKEE